MPLRKRKRNDNEDRVESQNAYHDKIRPLSASTIDLGAITVSSITGVTLVPQPLATTDSPTFTGLNLSGLTATDLVATDGSKNFISMAYDNNNTGNAVVRRDAFGSFSAQNTTFNQVQVSTLTASTLVSTDGSKVLSSATSGLSPTFTGLNLSGLTASDPLVTDGSKNLASVSYATFVGNAGLGSGPALIVETVNDYTLTNPPPLCISLTMDAASKKLILPAMNTSTSLKGPNSGIFVLNGGAVNSFTIATQDGVNITGATVPANGSLWVQIFDTSTANGIVGVVQNVTNILGTANQIVASQSNGQVTLSTPQSIGTGSSPTFTGLNLSGLTASSVVQTDGSKNFTTGTVTNAQLAGSISNSNLSGNPTTTSTASTIALRAADASMGFTRPVSTLPASGNTTVNANQSGTTFYLPRATANNTVTMPAVASGLFFKFITTNTADGTHTHTITFGAGTLNGSKLCTSGSPTLVPQGGKTSIVYNATAANTAIGDYFEVQSDGTNWYGFSLASAAAQSVGWIWS